ncbi:MinD/ParA family ATP-binding protein [Nocardia yamanashiensis]|uniref:MinD/ParA family ATP-binding protein n=1 Tax=Nocardia yamanashiensis TaxID=209247 RepID=UPI0009FFE393|nr:MinD/ParA family protein [Nocardia yamanashiensis]
MSEAPTRNGAPTGPARARGGYDAFFAPAPETTGESTGASWRESVGGRNEEYSRRTVVPPRPRQPTVPEPPEPTEPPTAPEDSLFPGNPEPPAQPESPRKPDFSAPPAPPNPAQSSAPVNPAQSSTPPNPPETFAPPPNSAFTSAPPNSARASGPPNSAYTSGQFRASPFGEQVPPQRQTQPRPGAAHDPAVIEGYAGQDAAPPRPPAPPAPAVWHPEQQSGWQAKAPAQREPDGPRGLPISLTSTELLAEIAASHQAHLRSTSGMRGALNKVGFNLGLSPTEQRTEDRRVRIRRHLVQPYRIAVLNVKGGVGRTTTVAGLASTFAALRPDRVVAVDANPDFGDLAARTSRHPYGLTLRDLAQAPNLDAFAAVQSFASITMSDLAVVASPWSTAAVDQLSGPEYLAALNILQKHYNLLVIDCGTGVLDSATSGVLRTADAVVVVTPATVRGVTGAVATLEWLDGHGLHRLAAESVIAIVHQQPSKPIVEIERIEELFTAARRPTYRLPYDEHLAEGGEIDLRLFDKDTALAFEDLAAGLADAFPDDMTGAPRGGRW